LGEEFSPDFAGGIDDGVIGVEDAVGEPVVPDMRYCQTFSTLPDQLQGDDEQPCW